MSNYLKEMITKANEARDFAYAPYSHFPVGACLRTKDGTLFTGCNVENASYSLTICSESIAVAKMVGAGHRLITDLVVIAEKVDECPPCGACRQRIYEFSDESTMIHLATKQGVLRKSIAMKQLLAEPFQLPL